MKLLVHGTLYFSGKKVPTFLKSGLMDYEPCALRVGDSCCLSIAHIITVSATPFIFIPKTHRLPVARKENLNKVCEFMKVSERFVKGFDVLNAERSPI